MDIAAFETERPRVVAAGTVALREWARDALVDVEVDAVETDAAVVAALDDGADCVLLDDGLADGTPVERIEAIRERTRSHPVLYAPESGSAADAKRAVAAGVTEYLPRVCTDADELRERFHAAVAAADERRQLERERNMFRELMSNTPFAIYFKDADARHVCVSSHATASVDHELLGKTDFDVWADDVGEEAARRAYEDDLEVIETGDPVVDKEERHVTDEGETIWLRTTKIPWRDQDGDIVGLIGITRDVSEIKEHQLRLEQEKQRLEQFASFASHDLRNPVNIAKGYLERAVETGEEEPLEEVVGALDRMDQLIDDLLNMARPDEDRVIEEWADLADLAERAWDTVEAPDATLECTVPRGVEIQASAGGLRQLLENLFKNAVEHGGSDVTVEFGLTPSGFYVADDGPGIPEDERDQVFEYGYTTGGTGVGLAITKEIADAHRWRTTVTESAAGGARFEFDRVVRRPPSDLTETDATALVDQTNVGDATPVGDARRGEADGDWVVEGGGRNFWGNIEEYYAVHGPAEGDVRVEARLRSVESVHEYSKAGLLLADAVEPGSLLTFVGQTAAHGAETAWRSDRAGDVSTRQYGAVDTLPRWFRIERVADRVTCATSTDGEEWTYLDQHVIGVDDPVQAGLAVCSHNEQRVTESVFEDVRVVGLDAPDAAWPE